ncbi:hypothetical protein ACVIGA_007277 [Bradyrhizobium sp. USDA 3240]
METGQRQIMGKNRWRTARGLKFGQLLQAGAGAHRLRDRMQPNSIMPYTAGSMSSARRPPIGASFRASLPP